MEAFPEAYTEHNLPLVLLSGLGVDLESKSVEPAPRDNGTRINLSSEKCTCACSPALLEQLLQFDGSEKAWNSTALQGPSGKMLYKMKPIDRTYALPPRKAAPLAQPTSSDTFQNTSSSPPRSTELHSPLSPLSPGSPVYPDGIFTPAWFIKHQQQVPALLIAFFDLHTSGKGTSDDQIKADINAVRAALIRSGYRTKFAAVLISDRSILQDPGLEDRISAVRRATGLDKLGLFFVPPISSQAEIASFVDTMMRTLQPQVADCYRELTKHARRKKQRVGPNPTQWNPRYEIKQGFFAEVNQDMDAASRHYLTAIEELFGEDGALEVMPTWSPRWNEVRLLADSLAIRIIRCQLWNSSTTVATQFWSRYRSRVRNIVNRRGKGMQTYAGAAWESKWAESMAQLITRAELPAFQQPQRYGDEAEEHNSWLAYIAANSTERINPFHSLHHPGYWLRLAAISARIRRQRAFDIPEVDRTPPGQSRASVVAKRTKSYDMYLVANEPHEESPLSATASYDHTAECTKLTTEAIEHFDRRSQKRMSEILRLDIARDFAAADRHGEALEVLQPLLEDTKLREEGWHGMLRQMLVLTTKCARAAKNAPVLLAATYELLCLGQNEQVELLSFRNALDGLTESDIALQFENRQRLCPIDVSFAFETSNTSVGEAFGCELLCSSRLHEHAELITPSRIQLLFDNGRTIRIHHDTSQSSSHLVTVEDSNGDSLDTKADLALAPAQSRTFDFSLVFKEAKVVRLVEVTLVIEHQGFSITHALKDEALFRSDVFFGSTDTESARKTLPGGESTVITVAPKPPKVQIVVYDQKKRYYTDESFHLIVEIINREESTISGNATARVVGDELIDLHWIDSDGLNRTASESAAQANDGSGRQSIDNLAAGAAHKMELLIKAPSDPRKVSIEIAMNYSMLPDAAIQKTTTVGMEFTAPFEMTLAYGPLLADVWPSYFDPNCSAPEGIPQLWRLNTQLSRVAGEKLVVHGAEMRIGNVLGESLAQIHKLGEEEHQYVQSFDLFTKKLSLDDRRPTLMDLQLEVEWGRENDEEARHVTKLPLPRLTLAVSEPRVLCTRGDESAENGTTILYHIENPSTHFLTYNVTMEASEDFAFSGPKFSSLSLAPLSRHCVRFEVSPHHEDGDSAEEERWIWPSLLVFDSYYQKTLRVQPGGPDVKVEGDNIGVLVQRTSTWW